MTETDAVNLARSYAARWGVGWRRILSRKKERTCYLAVETFLLAVDAGDGLIRTAVHSRTVSVRYLRYWPIRANEFLPPLWAAFPTYSSVATGWRQGDGEAYKYRWHSFYRGLPAPERADYQRRFPTPDDADRCWRGFYELIADVPADGGFPIAEIIIGRIP